MTMGRIGEGLAWKFGDDISTDLIAPGKYFHLRTNLPEMAKHVLEDATLLHTTEKFVDVVSPGDYVVGGKNFGLGSSREHAPAIIKLSGIRAVLAKSFARIFFRNSINVGLPLISCDTDRIASQDRIDVDMKNGYVLNKTQDIRLPFHPLPDIMIHILNAGGLVNFVKRNQGLVLPSS
jgi:3-isopropylmalate/(R)-2-methylmalate dehydratase small subunit